VELLRRVLSVGIDPAAIGVVLARRVFVSGRDDDRQAAVLREAEHLCASLQRDLGSAVHGAVVDDENVHVRKLLA
jgi:hypothetical protein